MNNISICYCRCQVLEPGLIFNGFISYQTVMICKCDAILVNIIVKTSSRYPRLKCYLQSCVTPNLMNY
jgi:hypothetical protein